MPEVALWFISQDMTTALQQELSQLSTSEKLRLVEELWDEISREGDIQDFPLCAEHRRLLDERYGAFLAAPEEGASWEEVKKRLLAR